jgi:uncharacterized protein YndB with AHSA1/START domain
MGGVASYGVSKYREVVAPERLVFVQGFADEHGAPARHPLAATWPLYMLATLTFTEVGEHTLFRVKWVPHEATAEEVATFEAAFASMNGGWGHSFEALARYLATQG